MSGKTPSSFRAQPVSAEELLEKVKRELGRYEHPLFDFDARAASGGIEVVIRFKPGRRLQARGHRGAHLSIFASAARDRAFAISLVVSAPAL